MNETVKKEFIEAAKDLLSISVKRKGGSYGESDYVEIELLVAGEVVSTAYIDLPSCNNH